LGDDDGFTDTEGEVDDDGLADSDALGLTATVPEGEAALSSPLW